MQKRFFWHYELPQFLVNKENDHRRKDNNQPYQKFLGRHKKMPVKAA